MGICRSPAYWYWSMSTSKAQKNYTDEIFRRKKEREFFEEGILKKTRTASVCLTCQHFNYRLDSNLRVLLASHLQQLLTSHVDYLIYRFNLWIERLAKETGWCPEAV